MHLTEIVKYFLQSCNVPKFLSDQTTCECKPIVSTCSAMGTTGGILGDNGNCYELYNIGFISWD